jgi:hypothetical protein
MEDKLTIKTPISPLPEHAANPPEIHLPYSASCLLHSAQLPPFTNHPFSYTHMPTRHPLYPCACEAPLCPCAYEALMQNKPNPQNPKTNATTCFTKSYEHKPPHPARKNKPNQTQSQPVPIHRERAGTNATFCAARNYENEPPRRTRKYKPNLLFER